MQDLFGGSNSNKNEQSTSGFSLLPKSIQDAFTGLATTAGNTLNPGGTPNASLETLPSLNSGATNALSQLSNSAFAPTAENVNNSMNLQTNPYDSSVIGSIQNAQNGNLSQLNQYLTNAGQFGSNRGMLGANDIAMQQANQVGTFKNQEFQNAMDNALTTIPQAQTTAAGNAVNAGVTQQGQQMTNQQAPITALAQLAQLMGVLPQSGGSQSTGNSNSSSSNGIIPVLFGGK